MGQFIGDNGNNIFQAFPTDERWTIVGNGGDDTLTGGEKRDKIYGNDGNDQLRGGGGNDYIAGGIGNDSLYGNEGNDQLSGGEGNDSLLGGDGNDFMGGGAEGDDFLYGEAGNDALFGVTGNDSLYGGSGNDQLFGEAGNDKLSGYGSTVGERDELTGGDGADTFILGEHNGRAYYLGGRGHALITDFRRSQGDKIQIHGSISEYVLIDALDQTGNGTRDTAIYKNNDLICIVEGGLA